MCALVTGVQTCALPISVFTNSNGWPDPAEHVTAHDLATIAERTIRDFPDLYRKFYGQKEFTWGKTLGAGAAITQSNRNPLLGKVAGRSEEHTSELQSLMRISHAVFCLKKKIISENYIQAH